MKIIGLVIHLKRAVARRPVAERLAAACGVPARLLDAVDGKAMAAADLQALATSAPHSPHYPFPLGPGEFGCFLSHRLAWAALLESEAEAALILEDDMEIGPEFADALRLATRHVGEMGYVQFQTRAIQAPPLDHEGGCVLMRPKLTPLRTSGQLVHRAAAERLLAASATIDRPVDAFLQMHWLTGVHPGAIAPSGLRDVTASAGGSTIKSTRSLGERIMREVQRTRYRRAIRRLSERTGRGS